VRILVILYPVQIEKFKGDVTVKPDQMAKILTVLVNHSKQPMFVHCLDGTNITGLVVMCLRKLQMWKRPAIVTEFSRFLYEDPEEEELTYLKFFKQEVRV
jgi:tyrosine-protein phosphatase OCA6